MRIWTPELCRKPPYGALINPSHSISRGLKWCWLFNEGCRKVVTHVPGGVIGDIADTTSTWFTWGAGRMGPELVMATTGLPRATGVGAHGTDKLSVAILLRIIATRTYGNVLLTSSAEGVGLRMYLHNTAYVYHNIANTDAFSQLDYEFAAGDTVFLGFTYDNTADARALYFYHYNGTNGGRWEVKTAADTRILTAGSGGEVFFAGAAGDGYALNSGRILTAVWDGRILTEAEMKYLVWNPFCFFAPVETARHYKVPAAGGSSIPVFMNHYRRMRSR